MKTIKVTGSMTISKLAIQFFPSGVTGGKVILDLDATTREATEKRATNNLLSLESLCYALVKSGVVGKANLANILALAAESKDMDSETAQLVETTIAEVKERIETTLPMVPVAAGLIIVGKAELA